MPDACDIVSVVVPNGTSVLVEVRKDGGYSDVTAVGELAFQDVLDVIEGVGRGLSTTIERLTPKKAVVEFGLEVSVQEGKLTALVCRGSAKANLTIKLEWGG